MSATSVLPAILSVLVALGTAAALGRRIGVAPLADRFATIDGLRGYLAFLVFVHHACIWHFYARTGDWSLPPSALYTHFGQASVVLFFMITAFLFFNKLLEGRTRSVDWLRLFVSRVFRLVPLYAVMMGLLLLIVAWLSDFTLRATPSELFANVSRWLLFTVSGSPDLNRVEGTMLIVAGVTWSLPYEWLFYLSLPLIAIGMRTPVSWHYVALGVIGAMGMMAFWKPHSIYLLAFGGGILASVAAKSSRIRTIAGGALGTGVVIASLVTLVTAFPDSKGHAQVLLLALVFVPIACGNGLFGLLTHRHSRALGEMAYGLYLLHGILLFVVLRLLVGPSRVASWSPVFYWGMILLLTPVLVSLCAVAFVRVERPAMRQVRGATAALRRLTNGGER